jgi:hypothetical protein
MRKSIAAFLCTLCLLGCLPEFSPLVSGTVCDGGVFLGGKTLVREDKPFKSWSLSQRQLKELSSWLKLHHSEWSVNIGTSPPPPSYSILLTHSDGAHTQIDLFSINESWQHAIFIYSYDRSGKLLFGGKLRLPNQEIINLKELLSATEQ